jgi:hypothetical protein
MTGPWLRPGFGAALACVLAAAVAAGCGGTTKTGVSGESGASLVRAGALAYVALDSDLGSSQWKQVDKLLRKFPAREKLLSQVRQTLSKENLDYDRDIEPAVGPEVDIAVSSGASPSEISVAWLTKPDSIDKAKALIRKLDATSGPSEKSVSRVVDGWVAVADSEDELDRTLKGSADKSLADDATFKSAMEELPADALAKAYVNGRQLADLVGSFLGGGAQTTAAGGSVAPFGLDKLEWLAASLEAKDDGIRFEGGIKGAGGGRLVDSGAPYASKLISGVPAGALAFLTFRGSSIGDQLGELRKNPEFGQALQEAEEKLGMRLDDVIALLAHEVAFYVRRGPGIPEFSLALETPDTQRALTTLDRLAARIARLVHTRVYDERQNGVDVKSVGVPPVTVRWAGFDGRVLVTTAPTGIGDYRASGDKLSDDPAYKDALDAAGAPDETGGLIYVNLHDGAQLIENYLGISGEGLPADVRANLEPLQSFVAYSTSSGDLTKLAAFLQIK